MADWIDEVQRRIGISEGSSLRRYYDTQGIPTIGVGFNLERPDAARALLSCGVSDMSGILSGTAQITPEQCKSLFAYSFGPIIGQARASLAPGIFDALTDARRFVICDLVFNMGEAGWLEFVNTRALINQAQAAKTAGQANAHALFVQAGSHLKASAWYWQVGNRAKRDVAMLVQGIWCDANGSGSDIYTL